MDAHVGAELPEESFDAAGTSVEQIEGTSAEYLRRWTRLVSTTNWEKGRIIGHWRRALIDAGAPPQAYSDEAWARRVGHVSGQHVGRLRRVFERFGEVAPEYPGLYWSHFQAALDWEDAEMWLEGALHSRWSVSQMRQQRWETIGSPPEHQPREQDVVLSEMDEDVDPANDSTPASISDSLGVVRAAHGEAGAVEAVDASGLGEAASGEDLGVEREQTPQIEPIRPFADLPPLPDDLAEAFEAFKLAIVNHRVAGWRDVPCQTVLAALDALRQLALAPVDRA